jgi:membrane fusion protein (multidrug efflux system)
MNRTTCALLLLAVVVLSACGQSKKEEKKGPPPAVITVTQAVKRTIEVVQESVGTVGSDVAPVVAAEVRATVTRVFADAGDTVRTGQLLAQLDPREYEAARHMADAEVKRVRALLGNQERLTARNRQLAEQNFISATSLDASVSQLAALREQLRSAQAALASANLNLAKTRILSPMDGKVEARLVSRGDFANVGKPLFQLTAAESLRVRLPFPETVANLIHSGQKVRLSSPTASGIQVEGTVTEVKPMVGAGSGSFDAVVALRNPGGWKPGASVNGLVIVGEHPGAVAVPESSVVIRPAGTVVYVIQGGKALQRVVHAGEKQGGFVEILSGLAAGELVAVDGAGFLTDKAGVVVRDGQNGSRSGSNPAAAGAAS